MGTTNSGRPSRFSGAESASFGLGRSRHILTYKNGSAENYYTAAPKYFFRAAQGWMIMIALLPILRNSPVVRSPSPVTSAT